jgi:replication factor C subunit 3/5
LSAQQIQGRLEYVASQENIDITPDGIQAILSLSGGDMRRVLNLLQSTAMSNNNNNNNDDDNSDDDNNNKDGTNMKIDETAVYLTSGAPLPKDMNDILSWLMNDTFRSACTKVTTLCTSKGYALADVLEQLTGIRPRTVGTITRWDESSGMPFSEFGRSGRKNSNRVVGGCVR